MIKEYLLQQFSKEELIRIIMAGCNEYKVQSIATKICHQRLEKIASERKKCGFDHPDDVKEYFKLGQQEKKWEDILRNI